MLLPRSDLQCMGPLVRGPWHVGFSQHLPANRGEDQKNVVRSEREAPGTVLYFKSDSDYSITFIKRLDEGLSLQLLGKNLLIPLGLYI